MTTEADARITVREAARMCGCSPETVRRWILDGKLRAQKRGNRLFIQRTDLERLLHRDRETEIAAELALLDEIDAIREEIRQHVGGNLDPANELLRRDRDRESCT